MKRGKTMKKYLPAITLGILLSASLVFASHPGHNTEKSSDQKSILNSKHQNSIAYDAAIKVKGLVCDFCAQALSKKFKKAKEIKDFSINMKKGIVSIQFVEDKELTDKQLITIINQAGYDVSEITRAYNN